MGQSRQEAGRRAGTEAMGWQRVRYVPGAGRALGFLLFFSACLALLWFTPARHHLHPARIASLLEAAGAWAPLAFVLTCAVGECLLLPVPLFCTVAVFLFGATYGFLYVWLGSLLAAALSFSLARSLGRDAVRSFLRDRFRGYDQALARNGFSTVLTLRLLYAPFLPTNFGMGLSRVRLRDYLLGTALGMLAGLVLLVFILDQIKTAWLSGDWSLLRSGRMGAAALLAAATLALPPLVKRWLVPGRTRGSGSAVSAKKPQGGPP